MEKLLIKKIAERYGVKEEEAEEIFESLKEEDEEFKKLFSELTDSLQVMSELPEPAKNALVPVVQTHLLKRLGGDDFEDMMKRITAYTAMLKTVMSGGDDEKVEGLRKELQELKDTLFSLKEAQREEEMDRLWQEIQDLKKAIVEAMKAEKVEKKDDIDQLEEILNKIEETKEKMKRLGLLKEAEKDDTIDIKQAEELLKKAGYRVEPPPDWFSVQRIVEQEIKKKEEEIRKKLEEELGIQERRMSMLMDLAMALIEGVIGASTSGGESKVAEFVSKVKHLFSGGGSGGEQAGGGGGKG